MTDQPTHDLFTLTKEPGTVRALFEGHDIADSDDVLLLREAGRPSIWYFPRKDVAMFFLRQTHKVTESVTKGQAIHFTIYRDRIIVDNVAWSYEQPHPPYAALAGRIAFLPEHVDIQMDDAQAVGGYRDELEER